MEYPARKIAEERPGVPFHLLGSLVVVGAVAHFLADDDALATDGGESLVLLGLSLAFFYAGYRLTRTGVAWPDSLRLLIVTVGFAFVGLLVSGFLATVRLVEGEPFGGGPYVLVLSAIPPAPS